MASSSLGIGSSQFDDPGDAATLHLNFDRIAGDVVPST
jgi:hypothetical protein